MRHLSTTPGLTLSLWLSSMHRGAGTAKSWPRSTSALRGPWSARGTPACLQKWTLRSTVDWHRSDYEPTAHIRCRSRSLLWSLVPPTVANGGSPLVVARDLTRRWCRFHVRGFPTIKMFIDGRDVGAFTGERKFHGATSACAHARRNPYSADERSFVLSLLPRVTSAQLLFPTFATF